MTVQSIITEVIKIILRHARPSRIYLYGSRNGGEARDTSDIDMAFEDPAVMDMSGIEKEIDALDTLLKIEVKNLSFTGERFRERVRATGKVLYSADKKLRFEDSLYNLTGSLGRLNDALSMKEGLFEEGFSSIFPDVMIKRFEFTYEMSWKTIKRYLDFNGIDCKSPRACFREAYAMGIIEDEQVWIAMIEDRNLSSHIYSENEIKNIVPRLEGYIEAFKKLEKELAQRLRNEG